MLQLADRFRVLEGQLLTCAHFFGGATERERLKMISKDDVGTNAGNYRADIVVQAAPDGRDANHHGDANHDSKHSQRRAHLVAANGISRHLHNLAEFVFVNHGRLSNLVIL